MPPRQHWVLLVDDDAAHRRTVQRALRGECSTLTAAGGEEALAVLARRPDISLLLSDQRMPGMTGVELLARAAERHPQVIRMLLTAYAEVSTLGAAINAGHVYAFLSKPWQPAELRLGVRRGLERRDAEIERGDLVRRLRAAAAAAQREADAKTRLLALLAHELGTPAHIALNASALLAESELPEAARRWVGALRRASGWMARGVAQVHGVACSGRQPLRLRRRACDVRRLVEAIAVDLRIAAADRRVAIACAFDDGAAPIDADPRWLREAVWNLASNAVRNTPDGGLVEIGVRRQGRCAEIAVRDSGRGIAAERFGEIFEPFSNSGDVHLHGSGWLAFGARGLGLGLALTKRIAEAHGGGVSLESRLGEGSCFRLQIAAAALD